MRIHTPASAKGNATPFALSPWLIAGFKTRRLGIRALYISGMNDRHAIRVMINERLDRRRALLSEVDLLDREVRVLEEALDKLSGSKVSTDRTDKSVVRRHRALSRVWRDALCFIASEGEAGLDDLAAWAELNQHGIRRTTLRSQMAIYTSRGWVERVASGRFRLTKDGAQKCGIAGAKEQEAPENRASDASSTEQDDER